MFRPLKHALRCRADGFNPARGVIKAKKNTLNIRSSCKHSIPIYLGFHSLFKLAWLTNNIMRDKKKLRKKAKIHNATFLPGDFTVYVSYTVSLI